MCVIDAERSPVTSLSFTPRTVTVLSTFQFVVENVRLAESTVAAVWSVLANATVTSPVGSAPRRTVYCSVPPSSPTDTALFDNTNVPSSSWTVTATVSATPPNPPPLAMCVIDAERSPARSSFTPFTVTVLSTFQLVVENVRLAESTVAAV